MPPQQRNGPVDIMVSPGEQAKLESILRALNIESSVMIDNVQDLIDREKAALEKAAARRATSPKQNHNMDWETYHPLEDFYGYFDYLEGESSNTDCGCLL